MAYIEPDGLFFGERLSRCTDTAQLHWPRLFLAANGYGRLELDYRRIVRTVYGSFDAPPSEATLWELMAEYLDKHLAYLYEDVIGQKWAQWYCLPRCLPDWKTRRDDRSPEPPEEACKWLGVPTGSLKNQEPNAKRKRRADEPGRKAEADKPEAAEREAVPATAMRVIC